MTPKVSFIVPVYNAKQTLHRCVDSILSQSFNDFELLLINDGSKDNSGILCDEYAKKDERVRVFHKTNGGVSSARNLGLDNARGEWIAFCDADDEIENKYLCLSEAEICDLIFKPIKFVTPDNNLLKSERLRNPDEYKDIRNFISENLNSGNFKSIWGKLIRKNKLKGLRFDTQIKVGEDNLFFLHYLANCNKIKVTNEGGYIYHLSELDQAVTKYNCQFEQAKYTFLNLFDAYLNIGCYNKNFEIDQYLFFRNICQFPHDPLCIRWYKDHKINMIYKKIKRSFPIKYRLKHCVIKHLPFVSVKYPSQAYLKL